MTAFGAAAQKQSSRMRRLPALLAAAAIVVGGTAVAHPASAAETGTFRALTYNIAGLPDALTSAPKPRKPLTEEIGRRVQPYDIVNVQEDLNSHAAFYSTNTHPNRTPTSGGAGIGSGLNAVSNFPFNPFQRKTWDDCSVGSGDCLTPKGFTFMRVGVDADVVVDVYNLHTDAGVEDGDLTARASNMQQLSDFIKKNSTTNPVVVMGDTNTRYTRAGDTIGKFAADNGLTDTWIELVRGGVVPAQGSPALLCDKAAPTNDCEVVDKILYRSGTSVSLKATAHSNEHDAFIGTNGQLLSDHDPIAATFSWTKG